MANWRTYLMFRKSLPDFRGENLWFCRMDLSQKLYRERRSTAESEMLLVENPVCTSGITVPQSIPDQD